MRKLLCILLFLLIGTGITWAAGTKKRKLPPFEYGSVIINNYSQSSGMPPVIFDHWIHRQYFTCRLCHVDVGFGMAAGATKIRSSDNMKGFYCGTCHNGRTSHNNKKIFDSCAKEYSREEFSSRCVKCHAIENSTAKEEKFFNFAQKQPKEKFGNGINWEKAEEEGSVKPLDQLEGVSINKAKLKIQPDFLLKPKVDGMPDIVFSHRKHTVWNGCELCHPDIFIGIKRGSSKYSMIELFEGKYCGVCHGKVAFPQTDCQRCHTKPV